MLHPGLHLVALAFLAALAWLLLDAAGWGSLSDLTFFGVLLGGGLAGAMQLRRR